MKENMLDVLMYLFEHYMDHETDITPDQDRLKSRLADAGFPQKEINKAFVWLEDLNHQGETKTGVTMAKPQSLRVYTSFECKLLSMECRGFMLFLEQAGILSPMMRELVIDRIVALEDEDIDLDKLKWVVLMVLFNQQSETTAYGWIEDIVLDELASNVH